jgi:hypothetical protein
VKRSGRNEPMWVAIHMCKEAMLGISLYSYLYYYLLCFLFNKFRKQEGRIGSAGKWRWGEVGGTNNVYTCE